MSITQIPDTFYDTTVSVQRRTVTADDIGGVSESWANIATSLKATIQPLSVVEQTALSQGSEFTAEFIAYVPVGVVTIKNKDRIIDDKDSTTYNIISVRSWRAARDSITTGHHYELILTIPKDTKS